MSDRELYWTKSGRKRPCQKSNSSFLDAWLQLLHHLRITMTYRQTERRHVQPPTLPRILHTLTQINFKQTTQQTQSGHARQTYRSRDRSYMLRELIWWNGNKRATIFAITPNGIVAKKVIWNYYAQASRERAKLAAAFLRSCL